MSVLIEAEIDAQDFEFGRVFSMLSSAVTIELESLVALPETTTQTVWVSNGEHESLEERIGPHSTVERVERIESLSERSLYTLEWSLEYDHLFRHFRDENVHLLAATGSTDAWDFRLRFRTHEALSVFQEYCETVQVGIDVHSVYNTPEQQLDGAFGITKPQQEALVLAVRNGYYDLPRGCNTSDLADRLEISDQAVTERLRRAIAMLTRNTIMIDRRYRSSID